VEELVKAAANGDSQRVEELLAKDEANVSVESYSNRMLYSARIACLYTGFPVDDFLYSHYTYN